MTLVWSILVAVALTAFNVWFIFDPRKAHKAQVSQGMQTAHVDVRGGLRAVSYIGGQGRDADRTRLR